MKVLPFYLFPFSLNSGSSNKHRKDIKYGMGKIQVKPEKIDWISETVLSFDWDNGEKTICFTKTLRLNCPCAICQERREKKDPLVILDSDQKHIELSGWRYVGNYAVALAWSDGHDTGIYTYEFLRQLCEDA